MPNKTAKLGLNTWLENEYVNIEEINDNFRLLDGFPMCVESGTKTSEYGYVNPENSQFISWGNVTWYFKRYATSSLDGNFEMSAKIEYSGNKDLKCNGVLAPNDAMFYSGISRIMFPVKFKHVYDVQMHLASNTLGWLSDITGAAVSSYVQFRLVNPKEETESMYKQVFINVKGVLA